MLELLQEHSWLLAFAIFAARVVDVTMGTVRTLMVFRGHRVVAAMIGFVESMIWIIAIGNVVAHLDQWHLILAYAGGFAAGNYCGIVVESRLAMGKEMLRVISWHPDSALAGRIREQGVRVIEMDGRRADDQPVQILLVVARRKQIPDLVTLIQGSDPNAVFTISDVKRSVDTEADLAGLSTTRGGWRSLGKRK